MPNKNIRNVEDKTLLQFNSVKAAMARKYGRTDLSDATVFELMLGFTEDALSNDTFDVRTNFELVDEGDN